MSIESQLPADLQAPVDERLQAAAEEQVVAPALGARRHALGAGGHAGAHRPARLARHRRAAAPPRPTTCARSPPRSATPASPTPCCSAWAARAWRPRCSGARSASGAIRLHVLDSTHPDADPRGRATPSTSRRRCSSSRRSPAARSRRCRSSSTSTRCRATARHFVAVTDPGTSLAQLGAEHGFRRVFENDPDIGGRYSALSYFGLVPAALAGVDVGAVLARRARGDGGLPARRRTTRACGSAPRSASWPCAGRDKLTFVVDDPLESFGLWAEQLVAESTGKQGRGILPIADEPLVPAAEYGADRVFVHLRHEATPRSTGRSAELAAAGHPVFTVDADGPDDLGRVFFLRSSPPRSPAGARDQPVRPAQRAGGQGRDAEACSTRARPTSRTATSARCSAPRAPAYLAIMGYLPYSSAVEAAAGRLREALVRRHHVATTFGYGPRFLHSTGQFHKGGPSVGASCRSSTSRRGPRGPGEALHFGTLIRAQADGDLQTLRVARPGCRAGAERKRD